MDALKKLRAKKLITQQELANRIGITRQNYNIWENNTLKCDLGTIFKLLKLLEATDTEIEEFFCELKQDYMSYKSK